MASAGRFAVRRRRHRTKLPSDEDRQLIGHDQVCAPHRVEQADNFHEEVEGYTDAERVILADAYQAVGRSVSD
jgi:hypothetical protein